MVVISRWFIVLHTKITHLKYLGGSSAVARGQFSAAVLLQDCIFSTAPTSANTLANGVTYPSFPPKMLPLQYGLSDQRLQFLFGLREYQVPREYQDCSNN